MDTPRRYWPYSIVFIPSSCIHVPIDCCRHVRMYCLSTDTLTENTHVTVFVRIMTFVNPICIDDLLFYLRLFPRLSYRISRVP